MDGPELQAPPEQPKVGSRDWLQARIAEHRQSEEQAKANANAHGGAAQAYERLLRERPGE